jgi:outer membrane protein TolC
MKIADARQAAAEARLDEASASRLPQVKLNARYAQLSHVDPTTIALPLPGLSPITLFPSIDHSSSVRLSVTQPIFTGFRLSGANDVARANASAIEEEAARDRADLALNVEQAYWGWSQSIEAVDVLERALAQIREHERVVQRLADQGLATSADVLTVQVKRSDVEVRLIDARTQSRLAMMSLNSLMGDPLDASIAPAERPLDSVRTAAPSDPDGLLQQALASRPDLLSLQHRRSMGEAGVTAARAGWYPQVFLAAGYDYARPNQRIIPPKDRYDGTWDVGVSLQWNVWDWMTTGAQTAQAEAALRQTEAGIDMLQNAVRLEVAQWSQRASDARVLVEAAKTGVRAAEESRRVMGQKFEQGTATTTDVLDAEVSLLQARLAMTKAGAELRLADARLRRAIGERP